jgi:hypothetical protein
MSNAHYKQNLTASKQTLSYSWGSNIVTNGQGAKQNTTTETYLRQGGSNVHNFQHLLLSWLSNSDEARFAAAIFNFCISKAGGTAWFRDAIFSIRII